MSLNKEETEVKKDKEWLLDEIERITDEYSNHSFFTNYARYMILEIEEAVNQLDEPELPSVPKFVADWYESEGKRSSWWNWFYKWGRDESRSDLETKTIKWMQDYNEEKFVDMFLHGYKVEKEKKFSVRDKEGVALLGKITELCGRNDYKKGDVVSLQNVDTQDGVSEWNLVLTEEEIKGYDSRYMIFAKPVERSWEK